MIVPGQNGTIIPGGKGKNGRDPRRSVYYDPVFNPYGAPPPGMEYRERGACHGPRCWLNVQIQRLRPHLKVRCASCGSTDCVDSSDSSDEESDGIELPEGPKPETDSDEDVPMPEGPPPGQPVPLLTRPPIAPPGPAGPPEMPMGFPVPRGGHLPFPPPPMMVPGPSHIQPRMALPHFDPLTGAPQQPFQAFRSGPPMQAPPPARPPPPKPSQEAIEAARKAATISAEPQLRDLRKVREAFRTD